MQDTTITKKQPPPHKKYHYQHHKQKPKHTLSWEVLKNREVLKNSFVSDDWATTSTASRKETQSRRQDSPCGSQTAINTLLTEVRSADHHPSVDLPRSTSKPILYHSWQPNNSASVAFSLYAPTVNARLRQRNNISRLQYSDVEGKGIRIAQFRFFSCKTNSITLEQLCSCYFCSQQHRRESATHSAIPHKYKDNLLPPSVTILPNSFNSLPAKCLSYFSRPI